MREPNEREKSAYMLIKDYDQIAAIVGMDKTSARFLMGVLGGLTDSYMEEVSNIPEAEREGVAQDCLNALHVILADHMVRNTEKDLNHD